MKNNPIDHHYVPVFYLKSWTSGEDKKLWYYKKVNDKVADSLLPNISFEKDAHSAASHSHLSSWPKRKD
jgi:hypothetical protein